VRQVNTRTGYLPFLPFLRKNVKTVKTRKCPVNEIPGYYLTRVRSLMGVWLLIVYFASEPLCVYFSLITVLHVWVSLTHHTHRPAIIAVAKLSTLKNSDNTPVFCPPCGPTIDFFHFSIEFLRWSNTLKTWVSTEILLGPDPVTLSLKGSSVWCLRYIHDTLLQLHHCKCCGG